MVARGPRTDSLESPMSVADKGVTVTGGASGIGPATAGRDLRRMVRRKEIPEPADAAECVYYVVTQPARCDVALVQLRPAATWQ